jgi:hypothetical protein
MPAGKDPFTTVNRPGFLKKARGDVGNTVTVIRKGSKLGQDYAKKLQDRSTEIDRASNRDLAGMDVPDTAAGNRYARQGAASVAADEVVNDLERQNWRTKYAKK